MSQLVITTPLWGAAVSVQFSTEWTILKVWVSKVKPYCWDVTCAAMHTIRLESTSKMSASEGSSELELENSQLNKAEKKKSDLFKIRSQIRALWIP